MEALAQHAALGNRFRQCKSFRELRLDRMKGCVKASDLRDPRQSLRRNPDRHQIVRLMQ
jgi:hypothetical protein